VVSIRKVKTSSGKTAVQVVHYKARKVVVDAHIGSADDAETVEILMTKAEEWIHKQHQTMLFPPPPRRTLNIETARFVNTTHKFAYTVLLEIFKRCEFADLSKLLTDLSIMRIIESCSKLRSIELLGRYFGIHWTQITVYRNLPKLKSLKGEVEKKAVACAKTLLHADLSLILYDVTTLYFETFKEDDNLRKRGFSKDHKENQPQIVIGLLVTDQGFPVGYEVFEGNTFEGHTMLPALKDFSLKHDVKTPTVVADAAMISLDNVKALKNDGYSYIVGARLANSSADILDAIRTALQKDGSTIRISTDRGDLICAYSSTRYRKDKHEMDRQIERAEILIAKKEPGRRAKFVTGGDGPYVLNETLKQKAVTLLGWKGYYTNIPEATLPNLEVVTKYRQLWHVEQTFRMAKSDLETRPIFHYKEDAIRAHILICFVALCVGKYMESITGRSLRDIRDTLLSVADAHIVDSKTGDTIILRSEPNEKVKPLLNDLGVSY